MTNILFVSGTSGNGGTQTWTKEYLKTYSNPRFKLTHVNLSARRGLLAEASIAKRIIDGLMDLREVYHDVKEKLREGHYPIMHAATSGSLGCLRDYALIKLAHRFGTKGILHCHYGCIPQDYYKKGIVGWLLRKSLEMYDQIWVLDNATKSFLDSNDNLKEKVFVTPNFIDAPRDLEILPGEYRKVAYVGNLIPTKGIYELVNAVKKIPDTQLLLAGPADSEVKRQLEILIGNDSGRIKLLGRLDNDQVIKLLENVDIMALPTYYPWEAFPISILEGMSHGALIISCSRAAIPDMIKISDNGQCGILVEPKSAESIEKAIRWCQANCVSADNMRKKAFDKAKSNYSTRTVFQRYSDLYEKAISN